MTADPPAVATHAYGPDPQQFLELTLPDGPGPAPVAVVLHGGFWRAVRGVELARPLAADLAAAGWAAVAVEYRRVGTGGGWPATVADVAAALDAVPGLPGADRVDLGAVAVVGHSAGGHLAAWAAARHLLPAGAPGAGRDGAPVLRVAAAVLQAGVLDLELAAAQRMGDGAVTDFLGGDPAEVPERYALASPTRLGPTGVPVLCVHGAADATVPLQQSERYRAMDPGAGLLVVPGDHMSVIDPAGAAWTGARDWLQTWRETVAQAPRGAGPDTWSREHRVGPPGVSTLDP